MAAIQLIATRQHSLPLWRLYSTGVCAIYLVLYHIYIGVYGAPTNAIFLPVHLLVALILLFLLNPLESERPTLKTLYALFDAASLLACLALFYYFLSIIESWQDLYVNLAPFDFAMGFLLVFLVLEAVRRTIGWAMILLALAFCGHALFADKFPGFLNGPPVRLESLMQTLVVGDAGVFGIPLLVAAQYIVLFLLFGRLLQAAGAGTFFTRIAFAIFGHRVGGPAKAGVVASGLFGTLSGSGVSNVLTTGSFTIPMMKRLGYRAPFAGGVEAAAAVGGSIMPPVMGAVAFMMAEFMGVDYVSVAIAAAIPALLYYLAIYWTVHFEARKLGLQKMSKDAMPNPWRIIRRHGYLAIPLVMIVVMLLMGYSIIMVALLTSLGTFLLSFTSRSTQLSPSRLSDALEVTGRVACSLSVTCACAGIIIGAIFATGLSFQVTQMILGIVKDQLWLILVVSALISLILGTGLTASAVYITMVATVIPILKSSGVPEMAAHMFAFYYGVVSDITPPTALAAVAAAGLARTNPMKTMMEASRLGLAAFIVPIIFVFQPALLMIGSPLEIIIASCTAAAGLIFFAAALAGYFRQPLSIVQRLIFVLAGILLIGDSDLNDMIGILVAAIAIAMDYLPERFRLRARTSTNSIASEEEKQSAKGFFGRWMERRIAKEQAEAAKEMELEGGSSDMPQSQDLEAWLKDDRIDQSPPPPDSRRWSAWAVLAIATLALGYMGSISLHATKPLFWLAALLGVTAWLVFGLVWTLRDPLQMQTEAQRGQA